MHSFPLYILRRVLRVVMFVKSEGATAAAACMAWAITRTTANSRNVYTHSIYHSFVHLYRTCSKCESGERALGRAHLFACCYDSSIVCWIRLSEPVARALTAVLCHFICCTPGLSPFHELPKNSWFYLCMSGTHMYLNALVETREIEYVCLLARLLSININIKCDLNTHGHTHTSCGGGYMHVFECK